MALTAKKIGFFSPDNRRVGVLLQELFPKRERMSMLLLRFRALSDMVDYFGYYDETGTFCGFSYTIHTDKLVFILFLAVDPSIHSKGFGSEIVHHIMDSNAGREITLHCEAADNTAENAEQRIRRIRFYERLGLHVTDYQFVEEEDAPYAIMSSCTPFPLDEHRRLLRRYGFGLYNPRLEQVPASGSIKGEGDPS